MLMNRDNHRWDGENQPWDILVLVKLDSDAAVKASGRHWYSTRKEVERTYGERERRLELEFLSD